MESSVNGSNEFNICISIFPKNFLRFSFIRLAFVVFFIFYYLFHLWSNFKKFNNNKFKPQNENF